MAQLNFDATNVEPNSAPEPVPTAWYNVQIIESEEKPTKDFANTGAMYLELVMQILDGEYAGRRLYDRLNLKNANPVAVDIAYKTLSAICHATGVIQVAQSEQLHNIPMQARAVLKPPKDNYDATNEVKGYRAIENGGSHQGGGAPGGWAPPNQGGGGWTPPQNQGGGQNNAPPQNQGGWTPPNQGGGQPQNQGGQPQDPNQVQDQNGNWQNPNGQGPNNQQGGGWTPPNQQQGGGAPWTGGANQQPDQNQQPNNQGGGNPQGFANQNQQNQNSNQNQGNGPVGNGGPSAGADGSVPPWQQ